MPQIPRYLVETGVPSGTGQRFISGDIPSAAPVVAQAAGQIAQASSSFLNAYTKANATLTNEDMKLDIDDKIGQVKLQYEADKLRMKEQGIHPDQYPEIMDTNMRHALTAAEQSLKYPESKGAFHLKMRPYQTEQWVGARNEALKIKHAQIGTMADVQQQEDVNAVVFGPTPEVRQQAMDRAVGRISDLVSTEVWSQAKGAAQYEKLLSEVQLGQARKGALDPATQEDTLKRLLRGDYQYLSPDKQFQEAYSIIDRVRADATRAREEEERQRQVIVSGVEKDVKDLVLGKDFDTAKIKLRDYRDYFKGGEYNQWQDIIAKSAEEALKPVKKESDPATRLRVGNLVYGATTPQQIAAAHAESLNAWRAGLLSDADGDKFTGHIQGMRVSNQNRTEDKALANTLREYSDVKDNIRGALKVQAPFGQLGQIFNNRAQQVENMALEDAANNWQRSREWWNKNKTVYISHISEAGNARVTEIGRLLQYKDPVALKAAKPLYQAQGRLDAYYTQIDLMREMQLIQQEMTRLKANQGPGGGALVPTPTPQAAPSPEPAGGVGVGGKRYGR